MANIVKVRTFLRIFTPYMLSLQFYLLILKNMFVVMIALYADIVITVNSLVF